MSVTGSQLASAYDSIVIGGGFYGCSVAELLARQGQQVLLVEQEADLMQRASYVNQARIHQGYHYPRSILTSLRSRVNFPLFTRDYASCVHDTFHKFYAIARQGSRITASQFRLFCERIGAPCRSAPRNVTALFDADRIEAVFEVTEYAFDANKLKAIMQDRLTQAGVTVLLACQARRIQPENDGLVLQVRYEKDELALNTTRIFNCSYSQINRILQDSQLPLIPLKHELTEMALIEMPDILRHFSVTVMDGPFFSVMPFPDRGCHSLSHVRYTPHNQWQESHAFNETHNRQFDNGQLRSRAQHMLMDARRYLPMLDECRYIDSLWEIKTVLPQSETDDSRPILFKQCDTVPGVFSIMGGKIDNIYDIHERLRQEFQ